MSKTICILGRQPALGLAELESLYGGEVMKPALGSDAVLLAIEPSSLDFSRLGGSIKSGKILAHIPSTKWSDIEYHLLTTTPKYVSDQLSGKLKLGLSVYGINVPIKQVHATGLSFKKTLAASGRSVRIIPNKSLTLNAAQVLRNKLTGTNAAEIIIARDGNSTVIAKTTHIQDIDAYAARDQARPKRDARVGMLPPKLAQIIINLACAKIDVSNEQRAMSNEGKNHDIDNQKNNTLTTNYKLQTTHGKAVLDPFCGTGVILQEASIMGFRAHGSDIDERMIDYTHDNLVWLSKIFPSSFNGLTPDEIMCQLSVGDATSFQWGSIDIIASETYLGRPFSSTPKPETLNEVMQDVDTIHRKFLKNVASQTEPGFRMCLAVPAWIRPSHRSSLSPGRAGRTARTSGAGSNFSAAGFSRSSISTASYTPRRENSSSNQLQRSDFLHLPVLDSLEELGYTRLSFVHTSSNDLIYHRENQIVARELVVLIRK